MMNRMKEAILTILLIIAGFNCFAIDASADIDALLLKLFTKNSGDSISEEQAKPMRISRIASVMTEHSQTDAEAMLANFKTSFAYDVVLENYKKDMQSIQTAEKWHGKVIRTDVDTESYTATTVFADGYEIVNTFKLITELDRAEAELKRLKSIKLDIPKRVRDGRIRAYERIIESKKGVNKTVTIGE